MNGYSLRHLPAGVRVSLAAAALICAAALALVQAAPASAVADDGRDREGAQRADVVERDLLHAESAAREVRRYWTPGRMRAAEPLELEQLGPRRRSKMKNPNSTAASPSFVPAASGDATGPVTLLPGRVGAGRTTLRSTEIPDTTSYPNRTHGKVFFSLGGGNYVCSGTVVNTDSASAVFTAGHCVNDPEGSGWATNWLFVPGYRNGSSPYGEFAASNLVAPNGWINGGNHGLDIGAASLATNGSGQSVQAAVGARGIAFNQDRSQSYTAWGYPAAPPFTGALLYTCQSALVMNDPWPEPSAPVPMGITCDMTGGSSGGGWVIGDGYVNSVNSFGYSSYPNVMFGPYFGEAAQNLYAAVCGCSVDLNPPDTTITSGPSGLIGSRSASFSFVANEPGATFECQLDSGASLPCTSPRSVANLADGAHTFAVRAKDADLNVDGSPAFRRFTVDATAPRTTIVARPRNVIRTKRKRVRAEVSFSSEPGARFQCRLDDRSYRSCASPFSAVARAARGGGRAHTIAIQATDPIGNAGPPALVAFTVIRRGR